MNLANTFIGNNHYNFDWIHLLGQYKKVVKKDDTVLEIGSSNPKKTNDLAKYCFKLKGLEKDSNQKSNKNTITGDWVNLNITFPKQKFDVIIASHIIEHVEDDLSCLNQTFDVLKTGGYFIFTTPNRVRLFERIRSIFLGKRIYPYHDHKREYIKSDLVSLIAKSKFNSCEFKIAEFVFGLHASPIHIFIKDVPNWLKGWTNFLEVIIIK